MKIECLLLAASAFVFTPDACRAEAPPIFLLKWGSHGSGPGQFQFPSGIGIGPNRDVYVTDSGLNRLNRFTSTGLFVQSVGATGSGDGQFNDCRDVAFGPDNLAYVSDGLNG